MDARTRWWFEAYSEAMAARRARARAEMIVWLRELLRSHGIDPDSCTTLRP